MIVCSTYITVGLQAVAFHLGKLIVSCVSSLVVFRDSKRRSCVTYCGADVRGLCGVTSVNLRDYGMYVEEHGVCHSRVL